MPQDLAKRAATVGGDFQGEVGLSLNKFTVAPAVTIIATLTVTVNE
jgi:hypothetical protein